MDFLDATTLILFPIALLGPGIALAGRRAVVAGVAAFGPCALCLVLVVIAAHIGWGQQRVGPDAENTNAMAVIELLALLFVAGIVGSVIGWGLRLAADVAKQRSRTSAD